MKQAIILLCFISLALVFADPLVGLSDEFDDASTITQWLRSYMTDNWDIAAIRAPDQLEVYDIDTTEAGNMYMRPYTSGWYMNLRGPFAYKVVNEPHFVAHSMVYLRSLDPVADEIPNVQFSMAGIMFRRPRPTEPVWTPFQENYVFMNVGTDNGVRAVTETKTTTNSNSNLVLDPTGLVGGSPRMEVQVFRVAEYIIVMYRGVPGGSWIVHRRYHRADMTGPIQVGLNSYTDWNYVGTYCCAAPQARVFNNLDTSGVGNPDAQASFDFFRLATLQIPPALLALDWSSPVEVPDATILAIVGDNSPTVI